MMKNVLGFLCGLSLSISYVSAETIDSESIKSQPSKLKIEDAKLVKNVVEQGVPEQALHEALIFLRDHLGKDFPQTTYSCRGRDENNVRPCAESERTVTNKVVTLEDHGFLVIVDYSKPSTEKRLFVINRETGEVQKMLATHGLGSGNGNIAYRFSNTKDSRQTSLGFFLMGEEYKGSYGATLRMYGLEASNDRAYVRDIVMHGAWYADPSFIKKENSNTGKPYNRLGLSWGCPAVASDLQKKLVPLLKNGALVYHYHPELREASLNGKEVRTKTLPLEYEPRPRSRPTIFVGVRPQPRPKSILEKSLEQNKTDKEEVVEDSAENSSSSTSPERAAETKEPTSSVEPPLLTPQN